MVGAEETIRPGVDAERMRALSRANQIRTRRAEVKRALRHGDLRIANRLADPPPCVETASLAELLLAVPGSARSGCGVFSPPSRSHQGSRSTA